MSIPVIDEAGNRFWYNEDGQYHREDGPAIIYTNGNKLWYKNGELHRDNGAAIEGANGTKSWYQNGIPYTEAEFRVLQFTKGIDIKWIKRVDHHE